MNRKHDDKRRPHGYSEAPVGRSVACRAVFTVLLGCLMVPAPTLTLLAAAREPNVDSTNVVVRDVIIYGGTSAAVAAAVQVAQMDRSVAIVCPDIHLGGLSSGGLGWTDSGNKAAVGGIAREFYHRVWRHYYAADGDSGAETRPTSADADADGRPTAWRWQSPAQYGNRGQGSKAFDGTSKTMWVFEPHVAEQVFEDLVDEYNITVLRDHWLDRDDGVEVRDGKIRQITMNNGRVFRANVFIDATYEGDLMAAAGVSYHVGRESSDRYGEQYNGVQTGVLHHQHHFDVLPRRVDPYVVPGDPTSGVIPRVSPDPPGEFGAADDKIQAYCFRMCLTDHPENRIPFAEPDGYDAGQYELMARVFAAGWRNVFRKFDPIPNRKTDTNNHGPMSTDNIGFNYDYPEADYRRRAEIIAEHEAYQRGWLYFIANDPRVPAEVQAEMKRWGLAADEFVDNDHWPHQIYVREARRMIGEFVMTENELRKRRPTPRPIGLGSYAMDSHNVQRYITPAGDVQNEGDIGVSTHGAYEIAWGAILPKRAECQNLVVPVCVSSSHIAFGSIRMEPVFMILGQSAATTAVMAINAGTAVQDVPYAELRKRLESDGQVLTPPAPAKRTRNRVSISADSIIGHVVDDSNATRIGRWTSSTSSSRFVGHGYHHDENLADGRAEAIFRPALADGESLAARCDVRLGYTPHTNRASNVEVQVVHAAGTVTVTVDQRAKPSHDGLFVSLGVFPFSADTPAAVTVTNRGTDGYVVVDAVAWVPVPHASGAPKNRSPRRAIQEPGDEEHDSDKPAPNQND